MPKAYSTDVELADLPRLPQPLLDHAALGVGDSQVLGPDRLGHAAMMARRPGALLP